MLKVRLAAAAAVLALTVTGCSSATTTAPPAAPPGSSAADTSGLLAQYGLAGLTGEQIVEKLDQDPRPRPLPLRGSVKANELLLSDGTNQTTIPLSTDQFYLSVAPYQTRTHECYFHNLGTCQGEMSREKVKVTITDKAGTVLVDEEATTYANGFAGFWIPKNTSGTVKITADGKTGETPFNSGPEGATCVTTLQLT